MYDSRETIERLGTSLSKQDLLAVVDKNLHSGDCSELVNRCNRDVASIVDRKFIGWIKES